jgi:hypothetical protein
MSDNAFNFDSQEGFKNRHRHIKSEKKMINRAALETDLIRGGKKSSSTKESQTVTGVFSTLIYDLKADTIENL